jgi:hypothetical protein
MKELDQAFIKQLVDMPSAERVAYLNTLSPKDRDLVSRAILREINNQTMAQLVVRINANALAEGQPNPPDPNSSTKPPAH